MTVVVSVYNLYFLNKQTDRLIAIVTEVKQEAKEDIVIVKPFKKPSRLVNLLSGFHIVENELLEDENSWENIAFARYYGIKGIRVLKEGLSLE